MEQHAIDASRQQRSLTLAVATAPRQAVECVRAMARLGRWWFVHRRRSVKHLSPDIRIQGFWLCCLCCLCVATALAAADDAASDGFEQVADGVYIRYGEQLDISRQSVDRIANTGFIVGSDSVAIIDPGGSPAAAASVVAAANSRTSLPISHIIITHVHPDHSLGLFEFLQLEADTQGSQQGRDATVQPAMLAHSDLWPELVRNADFFRDNFSTPADALHHSLDPERLADINPISSVAARTEIDLGNRILTLQAHATAHTATDLSIFDRTTSVLWAGDLIVSGRLPALDGNLRGWLAALDRLSAFEAELVIPGHGHADSWQDNGEAMRIYLQRLAKFTRDALDDGRSLKQFLDLPWPWQRSQWRLFEAQHLRNLNRAYTELEWE